jgi:hypothetical protein
MLTVIINDCRDPNAMGRQMARAALLFGGPVVPVGVNNDLEAAGCLVDELDAIDGHEGLILVNVAPRHGQAKKWPNGSLFGYFYYKKILVVSSLDGFTLSLAKKLGCLQLIHPIVSESESQFRSFDFLPFAAKDIWEGWLVSTIDQHISLKAIPDPLKAIWYIDCFGNAKTTLLLADVQLSSHATIDTQIGTLYYYQHLADVPDGRTAIVTGSSGIGDKRFLEIVCQGGSAAKTLDLEVGQVIL